MKRQVKQFTRRAFPSVWLKWRLMHHPRPAEEELSYLAKIVGRADVTVDIGACLGLYTRELARLSRHVHAFEPSREMADVLRRTSRPNVTVHEIALSDRSGEAELVTPRGGDELIHGLASIEPLAAPATDDRASQTVPIDRLDAIIQDHVAFVKIDVEGHELRVLDGARGLIERSRPVFLVEAEERHRADATRSIARFFHDFGYGGCFVKGADVLEVDRFDAHALQDPNALLPNGGRKAGWHYVNNFFYFPREQDGLSILRR
jgi:FkbM family methyltransferase